MSDKKERPRNLSMTVGELIRHLVENGNPEDEVVVHLMDDQGWNIIGIEGIMEATRTDGVESHLLTIRRPTDSEMASMKTHPSLFDEAKCRFTPAKKNKTEYAAFVADKEKGEQYEIFSILENRLRGIGECEKHTPETLEDGTTICFDCDKQIGGETMTK